MRIFIYLTVIERIMSPRTIESTTSIPETIRPKNRVPTVEMRLRRVSYKPLRATSILAREGHADSAAIVWYFVHFAPNCITRSTIAITAGVAELNDEVGNYAVKDNAAVVTSSGELNEIVYCEWGFAGEQVNRKRTFGSCHNRTHSFSDTCQGALVICACISCLDGTDPGGEVARTVSFQ
jgi:hypothetical protein